MLSPLKTVLCRHDFYWSERHRADRCRRCGKICEASPEPVGPPEPLSRAETPVWDDRRPIEGHGSTGSDPSLSHTRRPPEPAPFRPSAKALKGQALDRRENLLALLDRIAEGGQSSRAELLDALLGVIEDAHSADPVLFGSEAAGHFARLHEARRGLII